MRRSVRRQAVLDEQQLAARLEHAPDLVQRRRRVGDAA
jgi:hypothetical protein